MESNIQSGLLKAGLIGVGCSTQKTGTSRKLIRSARGRRRAFNKEIERMILRYKKKFEANTPADFSQDQLSTIEIEAAALRRKWRL